MTYQDIINSINHKIENSNFERFSMEQIIDELNNTYRDLANKTDIFETVDYLQLHNGRVVYTIPERIFRPTRATYRGKKIDFISQEAMDLEIIGWELEQTKDKLEYLVYNNLSDRLFKPYPILTDIENPDVHAVEYLGELSDVSDNISKYIYTNIRDGSRFLSSVPLGGISDLGLTEVVTIYGSYLPPKLVEADLDSSNIYIDEIHVNALIYGTAGNLLFTSGRTEDVSKGKVFMQLYGADETEIGAIRKKDFTGGFRNTARKKQYRTPFDE